MKMCVITSSLYGDAGVCRGRRRGGFYKGLCQPSALGTCGWGLYLCWWQCQPPCHATSGCTFILFFFVIWNVTNLNLGQVNHSHFQSKRVRGENGPGCWAMRPVEGHPDRCLFQWLLDTDIKVVSVFSCTL